MFAIAPYLIQVIDEYKQEQDLWKFFGNNTLRDTLSEYYKANLNKYLQSPGRADRMFTVSRVCKATETSVAGVYQTGAFGFESDIYSTTRKRISYKRKTDEADMLPFNFAFYMPKHTTAAQRKRGLLLLGRFNTLGVRHLTIPHLQAHFRNRFPDFSLRVERVVPQVVVETLLDRGEVKTIRLIKRELPADLADVFSDRDRDRIQDVELVIRSKRKSTFDDIDWLLRSIQNKTRPNEIVTIPSFAQDNIKLEIQIDGRARTVDLGNAGKISSNIELPVQKGADGHPRLSDWLTEADSLAAGIAKSWGMNGMNWKSEP